jgi:hypothetical protein
LIGLQRGRRRIRLTACVSQQGAVVPSARGRPDKPGLASSAALGYL